jgi:hypothetical protein
MLFYFGRVFPLPKPPSPAEQDFILVRLPSRLELKQLFRVGAADL